MFPGALRREIIIVLGLKALLLAALYFLFFSSVQHPETIPVRIESHLFHQQLT